MASRQGNARSYSNGFYDDLLQWEIVAVGRKVADIFQDVEPFEDLSEDGVFSIELREGREADEELAAVGIFSWVDVVRKPGHGNRGLFVAEFDFCRERVAWPASSGPLGLPMPAGWVSGLDERSREHPMEAHPVVKLFLDELFQVGDGDRGGFIVEPDHDSMELLFLAEADFQHGDIRAERGRRAGEGGKGEEDG